MLHWNNWLVLFQMHSADCALMPGPVSVASMSPPVASAAATVGLIGWPAVLVSRNLTGMAEPDLRTVDLGRGDKKPPNPYSAVCGSSPFTRGGGVVGGVPALGGGPPVGADGGGGEPAGVVTGGGGVGAVAADRDVIGVDHPPPGLWSVKVMVPPGLAPPASLALPLSAVPITTVGAGGGSDAGAGRAHRHLLGHSLCLASSLTSTLRFRGYMPGSDPGHRLAASFL
jgi:hypothetical protein